MRSPSEAFQPIDRYLDRPAQRNDEAHLLTELVTLIARATQSTVRWSQPRLGRAAPLLPLANSRPPNEVKSVDISIGCPACGSLRQRGCGSCGAAGFWDQTRHKGRKPASSRHQNCDSSTSASSLSSLVLLYDDAFNRTYWCGILTPRYLQSITGRAKSRTSDTVASASQRSNRQAATTQLSPFLPPFYTTIRAWPFWLSCRPPENRSRFSRPSTTDRTFPSLPAPERSEVINYGMFFHHSLSNIG